MHGTQDGRTRAVEVTPAEPAVGLSGDSGLVFLHPIGLDRRTWAEVASSGALALDFPGHGAAPSAGPVTMSGLVDHVVDHLGGPSTLVGLSLGGMVALQVAVHRPDVVASLVVACATSVAHPATMRERADATRASGMAGVLDSTLERWFTQQALATPRHPGVDYARRRLLDDDPEIVARYWDAMAGHDVDDALGDIGVPVTFVAGSGDQASRLDTLTRMTKAVPGAVLEVLDGPHMLPLERPAEFRAVLARHHERLAAARGDC